MQTITWPRSGWPSLAELSRAVVAFLTTRRLDLVIGAVLAASAAIASFLGSGLLTTGLLALDATDVWFDADLSRVFDNMVSRLSDYKRTDVHPFFAPIGFFSTAFVQAITGLDDWTSVRVVIALVAGTSAVLFYAVMRVIGLPRLAAIVFTVLTAVSAASMFWFIVPETMPFGAATILAGMLFAALAARHTRAIPVAWGVVINLITLSVTVTNWVVALLATLVNFNRRQIVLIVTATIFIAVVLSALQVAFFPRITPFGVSSRIVTEEPHFMFSGEAGSVITSMKSLFLHGMAMPEFRDMNHFWHWSEWDVMRVQFSRPPWDQPLGLASVALWTALLGLGAWAAVTAKDLLKFRLVLGGAILAQVVLHSAFGREAFLYTPHFTPLLVMVAALGALSRWRLISIGLAAALTLTVAMNNFAALRQVVDYTGDVRPAAAKLGDVTDLSGLYAAAAMTETPAAVVLADGDGDAMGAVSPGGSLFIQDADMTIGFLSIDDGGGVVLTSDTFWSPSTHQRVIWPWEGSPKVDTNNAYFQSVAQHAGDGRWTIDLSHGDNRIRRVAMIVRTEGGTIPAPRRISWADDRLLMDDRWEVRITPSAMAVRMGEETSRGRFVSHGDTSTAASGAAFALFELDHDDQAWRVEIADLGHTQTEGTAAP